MTGRHPQRTRAIDTWVGRAMMAPEEVTVAEVLRDAGWATGIFGKWHLGDCYPMRAMDQGFETSLVHRGGGIGQPADPEGGEGRYTDPVLFRNGERFEAEGYCTDVYFDAAIEWIRAQHAAERPFFAYLPTNAPHGPFHDVPEALRESYVEAGLDDRTARIFAMITNIDDNVGKLFAALDELEITDDTLVIFLTDNGPNGERFTAGLRGMKGHVHEGGVRSPFFAHWPARLEPGAPGAGSERFAAHIDVMPTLLEAAGVAVPDGVQLDGRSTLGLLERRAVPWPERTLVIQAHRGDVPVRHHHFFLRHHRWKLVNASGFHREVESVEPQFELYDVVADPFEQNDLAAQRRDFVGELVARYDAWFADVGADDPSNFDAQPIHLGATAAPRVALTRQDWRDAKWSPRALGHWVVEVVEPGPFDVRVRFLEGEHPRRLALKLGTVDVRAAVARGAREHTLTGIHLPRGRTSFEVELTDEGEEPFGPYQVLVALTRP
jgi:arylsulfatase/arylsulfatase A